jgi:UDP-glucose 4-epimerase
MKIPGARVLCGDLRDGGLVREAIEGQSIVFDFAGVSGAVRSNQEPAKALERECNPHLSLYHACATSATPPTVIFCSTRLVYGPPRYLPVDEEHPLNPQSIYAVHKITIENYLRVFGNLHGLPFVVVRLTNPYGPHQAAETTTHGIINMFVRQALAGQPIRVFGDGTQRRDYIYVGDIIEVFMRLALNERCHGQIFNLGGEEAIRLCDAANVIARMIDSATVQHVPWPDEYRSIETGDFQSDLGKIKKNVPAFKHTSFEQGLRRTIKFYQAQLEKNGTAPASPLAGPSSPRP